MRKQVINLRLVTKHDVAGSEAERFASSLGEGDQYALLKLVSFELIRLHDDYERYKT
jgi:hypothetical protein